MFTSDNTAVWYCGIIAGGLKILCSLILSSQHAELKAQTKSTKSSSNVELKAVMSQITNVIYCQCLEYSNVCKTYCNSKNNFSWVIPCQINQKNGNCSPHPLDFSKKMCA